ncbi:23773_t:CDS:2 [Dentiscutata erythropus]|uniref:23773_t:CDS:1 n=1 Tax=Dentiscutata erythropus TaxID=1348616 RepID=A0A9N9JRK9_9GLOM|nr:23773_t:CDS:2 [Dentiscutata erythropus]
MQSNSSSSDELETDLYDDEDEVMHQDYLIHPADNLEAKWKLTDIFTDSLNQPDSIHLLLEDLLNEHLNTFGLLEALEQRNFFEEFKKFANSDISELAKYPLIYEFIKFRIWSIVVYQQQLEELFNRCDMKVHQNMNTQLQESHI